MVSFTCKRHSVHRQMTQITVTVSFPKSSFFRLIRLESSMDVGIGIVFQEHIGFVVIDGMLTSLSKIASCESCSCLVLRWSLLAWTLIQCNLALFSKRRAKSTLRCFTTTVSVISHHGVCSLMLAQINIGHHSCCSSYHL